MGDLSSKISLFLEGSVFALYKQLGDSKKISAADIKKTLMNAFAINSFEANELFRDRRWNEGESVDIYMTRLP